MPTFFRRDYGFGVTITTGPQSVYLLLTLTNNLDEPVEVIELKTSRLGNPPIETVKAAAIAGVEQGNKRYGTIYKVLQVKYALDTWDQECQLVSRAADAIVEQLATMGVEGFEVRTSAS